MIEYLKSFRSDIEWVSGPDLNNNYTWDNSLPYQEEISNLVSDFKTASGDFLTWYNSPEQTAKRSEYAASILISSRKVYTEDMLERFKNKNIQEGINAFQAFHMHHRMRALEVTFYGQSFVIDVLNLAISGDIEIACLSLQNCTADAMDNSNHWLSQARLNWLINDMKSFLGWT